MSQSRGHDGLSERLMEGENCPKGLEYLPPGRSVPPALIASLGAPIKLISHSDSLLQSHPVTAAQCVFSIAAHHTTITAYMYEHRDCDWSHRRLTVRLPFCMRSGSRGGALRTGAGQRASLCQERSVALAKSEVRDRADRLPAPAAAERGRSRCPFLPSLLRGCGGAL